MGARTWPAGRRYAFANDPANLVAVDARSNQDKRDADIGLPIRVIETDGTELVVVQRRDLDLLTDKAARELAYADNRIAQLDLDWDTEALLADQQAGLDLTGVGFSDVELLELLNQSPDFAPVGIEEQGRLDQKAQCTCPNCGEVFTP
jgi:hypothetical protein